MLVVQMYGFKPLAGITCIATFRRVRRWLPSMSFKPLAGITCIATIVVVVAIGVVWFVSNPSRELPALQLLKPEIQELEREDGFKPLAGITCIAT